MIYETYPWKQDLLKRKRLIVKYNRVDFLLRDNDRAYFIIEKAIFYSAFIIRKIIDCKIKSSDEVDSYRFTLKGVTPLVNINILHHWTDQNTHDLEHKLTCTKFGTEICNWLIHSFIFQFDHDETGIIDSFYVSSDFDKNKILYRIELIDWMNYMDFVASDNIATMKICFDKSKNDYVIKEKSR